MGMYATALRELRATTEHDGSGLPMSNGKQGCYFARTPTTSTRRPNPGGLFVGLSRAGDWEERLVDEIEPKAEPRFRAVAEASRAEFGGVLVDVRDIHAKMPCDRVSCSHRDVSASWAWTCLLVTAASLLRIPVSASV
jgi:hypothetical protein